MDTRANFQRLLDDMDQVIRRKQEELSELDERLETARERLSDQEARELLSKVDTENAARSNQNQTLEQQDIDELLRGQRVHYEQQISNLNYELIDLDSLNQSLTKSNGQLQFEVDSLRVSNEKFKERLYTLNENLEEVQSANFELNIRLAKAESESQMQQKLLKKSHEQDQILMDAFNNKLESLKRAIALRDDEIRRLHDDNQLVLESLGIETDYDDKNDSLDDGRTIVGHFVSSNTQSNNRDKSTRKHSLINLANMIREKDSQIESLKNQLVQATREFENSTNVFEIINKSRAYDEDSAEVTNLIRPNATADGDMSSEKELLARCKMLEGELDEKDRHLHLISRRNRHFEKILPGEIVTLVENLQAISREMIDQSREANSDSNESKHMIEVVLKTADNLSVLLNEIGSSQQLLDTVDQLQRIVLSRDAQIKRLVRELNQLNAKINQDHIDAPRVDVIAEGQESLELEKSKTSVEEARNNESPPTSATRHEYALANLRDHNKARGDEKGLSSAQEGEQVVTSEEGHSASAGERGEDFTKRSSEPEAQVKTAGSSESRTQEARAVEEEDEKEDDEEAAATAPISGKRKQGIYNTSYRLAKNRVKLNYGHRMSEWHQGNLFRFEAGTKRINQSRAKFTIDSKGRRKRTRAIVARATARDGICGGNNDIGRVLDYRDRLRQLESENQLLELAMKEILVSIKWSDTRCSTILIDCPSLERLCQLLEARYIAGHLRFDLRKLNEQQQHQSKVGECNAATGASPSLGRRELDEPPCVLETKLEADLFQLVVMKSELDLLRGQNEQLRSDLKLQRRDFCQQHVWQTFCSSDSLGAREQGVEQAQDEEAIIEVDTEKLQLEEAECQTDPQTLMDTKQHLLLEQQAIAADDKNSNELKELATKCGGRCHYCKRLVSLAKHLLDCIVRIESRVNSSDETYINRLLTLYQLSQQLGHDLSTRDSLIAQLRRDNHVLSRQKTMIESRLKSLQDHLDIHNRICPLYNFDVPKETKSPADVQLYSATRNGTSQSIHSITIRSNRKLVEVPLRDSRIAISLLQSIIACLQARLDYKDERLDQLEQLLVSN